MRPVSCSQSCSRRHAVSAGPARRAQEQAPQGQAQQGQAPQEQTRSVDLETPWGRQSVDLAKLYDAVVDTVEQRFFNDALLKQLNWRGRANAARASVLAATTAEDAVRQINALLAELKTSHTALFTPQDYEYYILPDIIGLDPSRTELMSRRFWGSGPYYPGIGVFTRQIDGHHFVDGLLEGSPAERAGLRYGDEIGRWIGLQPDPRLPRQDRRDLRDRVPP